MSEARPSQMADALLDALVSKLQTWSNGKPTPTAVEVFRRKHKRYVKAIQSAPEIKIGHTQIKYADKHIVRRLRSPK